MATLPRLEPQKARDVGGELFHSFAHVELVFDRQHFRRKRVKMLLLSAKPRNAIA